MKVAIIICVLSSLFFFLLPKVNSWKANEYTYDLKLVSFLLMIGSFISIVIMW